MTDIIQEIIDRVGYTNASSIVILLEGEGRRIATAYDGTASEAAELFVTYRCGNIAPIAQMSSTEVCPGSVVSVTASGGMSPYTYLWTDGNTTTTDVESIVNSVLLMFHM